MIAKAGDPRHAERESHVEAGGSRAHNAGNNGQQLNERRFYL